MMDDDETVYKQEFWSCIFNQGYCFKGDMIVNFCSWRKTRVPSQGLTKLGPFAESRIHSQVVEMGEANDSNCHYLNNKVPSNCQLFLNFYAVQYGGHLVKKSTSVNSCHLFITYLVKKGFSDSNFCCNTSLP